MQPRQNEEQLSEMFVAELRNHSQSDRDVFASLQHELRKIARAKMRSERPDHTLQPTALVNEAYLKLSRSQLSGDVWNDSTRLIGIVARAMEQILNDHADAYLTAKRGGNKKERVPVDENQARELEKFEPSHKPDSALLVTADQSATVIGVREVLQLLRDAAPRQAQVVQLKFHGGLTHEEIAAVLEVSLETVKLDWRKAKAFMKVRLSSLNDE